MPKEYTKEELWKLYEKLSQELKEAIFAESTADNIWSVCEKNEIEEVSKVAKYAGHVLLGILPPDEFQGALEKELSLDEETAKKANREIFRFVFYPVKAALEELYKTEITPPTGSTMAPPPITKPVTGGPPSETSMGEKLKKDTYREPLD